MWELILVDNGSTDGTAGYLANLRDAAPLPVTVISNSKNRGFPAAINQGLDAREASTSCCSITMLLLPTDGWGG